MIAVVGGGITGLTTAFELQRAGREVVVLEATRRVGGVIRSAEVEGRVLDWGPQRARLTGRLRTLVTELGLDDQLVIAPSGLGLSIYRDGKLRSLPYDVAGFVKSDVVSWSAKARASLEPFTGPARPEESVETFFTRKFGRELYETVIGPLYGGLYASDPADMRVGLSLIHALREFGIGRSLLLRLLKRGGRIDPPPACSFRDGMQALPDALAHCLGARVRAGAGVEAIRRAGESWRVSVTGGDSFDAQHVVLTCPAATTARLLAPVAPAAAATIGSLRYNPLAVVHLEAEAELDGMGFKVAFGEEDLTLTGVTYNDRLFGRRNLFTAYLGGARHPEVATMDDDTLGRRAVRDFRTTTGHDARVLATAHERMPAWDVSWAGLEGVQLPGGLHIAANWWSRPGLPGRLAEAERVARSLTAATPATASRP